MRSSGFTSENGLNVMLGAYAPISGALNGLALTPERASRERCW